MSQKILLVIPAFNEEENIIKTCNMIKDYDKNIDYIVINDGSEDNTSRICKENNIKHINLIHNLGIGGAVQTGYKYAYENNYDIAIQFDGDGQHDINYINKIIEPIIKDEADLVIGSRFVGSESKFKSTALRRIGIKMISYTIKLCTNKKIYDTTSGYRACNKKIIEEFVKIYPTEYPESVSNVFLVKNNYRIKEVSVKMSERQARSIFNKSMEKCIFYDKCNFVYIYSKYKEV